MPKRDTWREEVDYLGWPRFLLKAAVGLIGLLMLVVGLVVIGLADITGGIVAVIGLGLVYASLLIGRDSDA